jgi:sugar lactone lactonase YvrE
MGIALLGILSAACSQGTSDGADLGTASDLPMGQDQASSDAAVTGPSLSLVAGALGGKGNVDGTGAAARFDYPNGVVADGAGNLYVSDTNNCTIRKVVLATGAVTTLVGSAGLYGNSDGIGAAARFGFPRGLALDGAGSLYVADNYTIRKVELANGLVTTLAGTAGVSGSIDGVGATARFGFPEGLAADGAGNLYVADANSSTIRKVVVSSGLVTTLVGSAGSSGSTDGTGAAARFALPRGLALDSMGNLYVADGNHTIRKVVVSSRVVTTVAGLAGTSGSTDGTGSNARFYSPQKISLDAAGNLYVSDSNNHTIRKVVVSSGVVTTLIGQAGMNGSTDGTFANARLNSPEATALDGAGNLYVTDSSNFTIRRAVLAAGVVTTLAGTAIMSGSSDGTRSVARFNEPQGVAADAAGNLYITDALNHTIRKVVASTGVVTTLAGTAGMSGGSDGSGASARFYVPYGVAVDGGSNLYIADTGNHTIRKLVLATGAVTTIAGTAGMIGNSDGVGAAARFFFPFGIAADSTGTLYIADRTNHAIRKLVLASGQVTTLAGSPGISGISNGNGSMARFNGPQGVTLDAAGNLYVADTANHMIRKVVVATSAVTTVAGAAGISGSTDGIGSVARFFSPYGVAVSAADTLYVADSQNSTIRKIELSSANVTTPIGIAGQRRVTEGPLPALLNRPSGLALAPSGDLFVISEDAVLVVR